MARGFSAQSGERRDLHIRPYGKTDRAYYLKRCEISRVSPPRYHTGRIPKFDRASFFLFLSFSIASHLLSAKKIMTKGYTLGDINTFTAHFIRVANCFLKVREREQLVSLN